MRSRLVLVLVAAAAALAVSACSGSGQTPTTPTATTAAPTPTASDNGVSALPATEILSRTVAALQAAPSVRLIGSIAGAAVDAYAIGGNTQVSRTGGGQGDVEARQVGTDLYVKGDATFYAGVGVPAALAAARAGKWVKTTAAKDPQVAQLLTLMNPAGLIGVAVLGAQPTKGELSTVDGQPVIELKVSAPQGAGSVFVATTGAPVPVRLTDTSTPTPFTLSYTGTDPVTAPTTVDITA